jgi:hypothetical protein
LEGARSSSTFAKQSLPNIPLEPIGFGPHGALYGVKLGNICGGNLLMPNARHALHIPTSSHHHLHRIIGEDFIAVGLGIAVQCLDLPRR